MQTTPSSASPEHTNTVLTFDSDVSGYNGTYTTIQYGVTNKPNAQSDIIFNKWSDNHNFNLQGNGSFIFNGDKNTSKNNVQISFSDAGAGSTSMYLNDNILSKDSSITASTAIYFGNKGVDDTGRNINLDGYENFDKVSLYLSGSKNTTIGNLEASVKNSHFYQIAGVGNNAHVTGDVILNLEDSIIDNWLVGQAAGSSELYPANTLIDGNIKIFGKNIVAGEVIGENFAAFGTQKSGIHGNIDIDLQNSTVKQVRGVNFSAGNYQDWNKNYFEGPANINIGVTDSVIQEELLATGAYPSVGNVKINVLGNTAIGYTDFTLTQKNGDGWIIAGAQRPGARIASTEVNLNTLNDTSVINIAGEVQIGSRQKSDPDNSDVDSVTGNATLNMLGGGTINIGEKLRAYHVKGQATLNMDNVTVNVGSIANEFDSVTLNNTTLTAGNIEFKDTATLTADLMKSTIVADSLSFGENNTLNLIIANGVVDNDYDFIKASTLARTEKVKISDNALYDLAWSEANQGAITLSKKSTAEVVENLAKEGVNAQQAATISAFADSKSDNGVLSAIT